MRVVCYIWHMIEYLIKIFERLYKKLNILKMNVIFERMEGALSPLRHLLQWIDYISLSVDKEFIISDTSNTG